MTTRDFAVRTETYVATLGDLGKLEFVPEALGDEFLDGYAKIQEAQVVLGGKKDLTKMDPETLR